MSSLSRLFPVALAGAITLAVACGDSSGPRPTPGSVTGVVGDNQSAPTGATLPIALGFIVLSSEGQPLPGVSVTWSVITGAAFLNPTTSTTNASGAASTTVTLGAIIGPVIVRGAVAGIPPVDFHLEAGDPCAYTTSYTLGQTVNATLTTTDCPLGAGYFTDFYEFTLGAQQGLTATMTASFDTFLEVYGRSGDTLSFVGFNNNISTGNLNSEVRAILAPGTYILAPSSNAINVTGAYTVTSATRAQTVAGCEVLWVTRGVTISDNILATDCPAADFGAGSGYGDAVGIYVTASTVLTLSERSSAVNAMLTLIQVTDTDLIPVASNDDSLAGTTTDAFIRYTVPQTGVYVVFTGTSVAGQTGAYTLVISPLTTLSVAAAGTDEGVEGGREPVRFAPPRLLRGWPPLPGWRRDH